MESNCCGASPLWETDLCSACKEHAEFYTEEEQEVNDLIEKLTHYYEVDLDNCKMTHDDWIGDLANAMLDPEYYNRFIKEYNKYCKERES